MRLRGQVVVLGSVVLLLAAEGSAWAQGNAGRVPLPNTSTNATPRKDPFKALEDHLSKSFQPFAPNNSLDGIMAPAPATPVPRAVVPNKRVLDLLQKRKEALELKTDDLSLTPKDEDSWILQFFDKKEKNKKPADLDQFYENLNRRQRGFGKGPGGTSSDSKNVEAQNDRNNSRYDPDAAAEDANLPGMLRDTAQLLRKMLSQDAPEKNANTPTRGTFGDVFGLGNVATAEKKADEKSFITEYKAWLNTPIHPAKSALETMAAPEERQIPIYNPMAANLLPGSSASAGLKQLADPNPALTPSMPQDLTPKVVNNWNPFYSPQQALPKYETPVYIPPKPNFDAPRRRF